MNLPGHSLRYVSAGLSHPGCVRPHNEDAWLARPDLGLWVVADGMGGHSDGAFASRRVVDTLHDVDPPTDASGLMRSVQTGLASVDAELRQRGAAAGPGVIIATTVVVLLAFDHHYACVWAGDSRIYLLRDGAFRQLTHDHSRVQDLLDRGFITQEEAAHHPHANIVTRAVGGGDPLRLDTVQDRLRAGDVFLLCSDGLFKMLSDREIAGVLEAAAPAPTAERLVGLAVERGATDNVTVVVVHVHE